MSAVRKPKTEEMILLQNLPHELDGGIAERASIGLIVLATDYTVEYEWRKIFHHTPGVALYHSRILNDDVITPDSLRAMQPRITACADLFTPATPIDVIAYGCTSASMAIGEQQVFTQIQQARPQAKCTTPITAALAAFDAFKANKIGVLTPYSESVNRMVARYITDRGYDVPVFGSFNQEKDSVVAKISPASIQHGVQQIVAQAQVEAVFVSCTSVRLVDACQKLEADLGIPLTSSNHAMAWHAMRLAGIDDKMPQFGKLFTL